MTGRDTFAHRAQASAKSLWNVQRFQLDRNRVRRCEFYLCKNWPQAQSAAAALSSSRVKQSQRKNSPASAGFF
jgi:hypothetical protein